VNGLSEAQVAIAKVCDEVKELLLAKNREYGNSAFEPVGIFSAPDPEQQMRVRIDDKLKRLANLRAMAERGESPTIAEDTEKDLIGYLLLLRAWRSIKAGADEAANG
jgi:hypothetical protein